MTRRLGSIDINIDPVLHIGGVGVHWYGLFYAVAFGVGLYAGVIPHLEKRGIDRQTSERYTVWAIVFGLLGARLYYVVQSSPPQGGSWFSHPEEILAVWHGGMAFFGAVVAAPLTAMVLAWREHRNWWLIADAAAVFGVLGQPIGRIGNVINGDILGHRSDLPWAVSYSNPGAILQTGFTNCYAAAQAHVQCLEPPPPLGTGLAATYQPAAVYEAIGTLLILAVLFGLRSRLNPRAGTLWITYLGLYAVSQLLIFFARGSEPTVGLGLKQAQWTAIVFLALVVPLMVVAWRRGLFNWAPEGRETGAILPPEERQAMVEAAASVAANTASASTLPSGEEATEDVDGVAAGAEGVNLRKQTAATSAPVDGVGTTVGTTDAPARAAATTDPPPRVVTRRNLSARQAAQGAATTDPPARPAAPVDTAATAPTVTDAPPVVAPGGDGPATDPDGAPSVADPSGGVAGGDAQAAARRRARGSRGRRR